MGKRKATVEEVGREGGKVRAARLTPERRSQIARQAALARWSKNGKKK